MFGERLELGMVIGWFGVVVAEGLSDLVFVLGIVDAYAISRMSLQWTSYVGGWGFLISIEGLNNKGATPQASQFPWSNE